MQLLKLITSMVCSVSCAIGSSDFVKLSEVEVLTLYHGEMTTGRRSFPVPQLTCVGGTAGCNAFVPKVVQCYNRGSDGKDIQWECKTDMDNAYRFSRISVSCEGYSYPDDPYVLKGSCGLEYTIDLTKEDHKNQKGYDENILIGLPPTICCLIILIVVGLIIYGLYELYRTCIAPSTEQQFESSSTNDDFGGYPGAGGNRYRANAPPPPGFRPDFTQGAPSASGASCDGARGRNFGGGTGAGGFWTGAATGGLLGYIFGNLNGGDGTHCCSRGTSWGRSSWSSESAGSSCQSSSTGTRTASGFGGTKRR